MEDAAIMDAPELATPELDTPIDAPEPEIPDGSEEGNPEVSETPEADATVDDPAAPKDPKAEVTKILAQLKATNPVAFKELKQAHYVADAFRKEFPGGLKEAAAIKHTIEEIGGTEGLQSKVQELGYFNGLDQQYTAGDPKFIEAMTDTPEGRAAYLKLATPMLAKFAELNPEGHAAYVARNLGSFAEAFPEQHAAYIAQTFMADMQASQLPLIIARLADVIPADNPKAQELWQLLDNYQKRIAGFAAKPTAVQEKAPPTAAPKQDDTRAQELDRREKEYTAREWGSEANAQRLSLFNAEWARLTNGLKLTDTQAAAVKELYASRLAAAVQKVPKYKETIDNHFASGKKDGYMRFMASVYKEKIPATLRAALDIIVARPKTGVTPVAGATPKNGTAAVTPRPGAAPTGYIRVGAVPSRDSINFQRTTPDMIREGKAVLASGKKVVWK